MYYADLLWIQHRATLLRVCAGRPSPSQSRAEITHHESVLHVHAVTDIDLCGSFSGPPQKRRYQEEQTVEEGWGQRVKGDG